MRTRRNGLDRVLLLQQRLEAFDDFRFQHVFDRIRVAVDSRRSNFGVSNQIQFPQAVLARQPGRFPIPLAGQPNVFRIGRTDQAFIFGVADFVPQFRK